MIIKPDKYATRLYIDEDTSKQYFADKTEVYKLFNQVLDIPEDMSTKEIAIRMLSIAHIAGELSEFFTEKSKMLSSLTALKARVLNTISKDKAYELLMTSDEKIGYIAKNRNEDIDDIDVALSFYYNKDGKIYLHKPDKEVEVNWSIVPDGDYYIKKWEDE